MIGDATMNREGYDAAERALTYFAGKLWDAERALLTAYAVDTKDEDSDVIAGLPTWAELDEARSLSFVASVAGPIAKGISLPVLTLGTQP